MNQTRFERSEAGSLPYWVCLIEEKCTGADYAKVQEFCQTNGLTISRHGHSVVWQREWYQVFHFAEEEHAARFMQEDGGERMHPSKEARGKNWAQWKKGTYTPKLEAPTTSETKPDYVGTAREGAELVCRVVSL